MAMWKNDDEMFALMKEKLYTPVVGDILDQMGYKHQFLPASIRPLAAQVPTAPYILPGEEEDKRLKVAGYACTVLENDVFEYPAEKPFGYMTEALDDLKPNEIYIATGAHNSALWGELLTACGKEPRPAALLLGQAADLDESETLLVIDGQSIPAWEYLYWLALDCRQMEERCEAAGEPVDWTAPLSDGGTLEDLVKADALVDTALYAAVGTWAAAYGCTLTDAERNALPERHYAYLTLEQGRHLTETGVQYAKLYALYETPGSALAPAENELALFEQQTAPLTAERLLIPFESDREAARQKAAELFAHLNTAADPSAAFDALLAETGGALLEETDWTPSLQDTVAALEPGQFSGIIETENGFVILRRLPADRDALREAYFDSLLQGAADASEIQVSSAYETLRPAAFWTALKQASG